MSGCELNNYWAVLPDEEDDFSPYDTVAIFQEEGDAREFAERITEECAEPYTICRVDLKNTRFRF